MTAEYTVLIGDDSAFARKLVKSYLSNTEFTVVAEAVDGNEVIEQYKTHTPDMVVLDIIMPEKSGSDALTDIMALDNEARILMLSSLGTEDAVSECLSSGARMFLQKPFQKDVLLRSLRQLVEGATR